MRRGIIKRAAQKHTQIVRVDRKCELATTGGTTGDFPMCRIYFPPQLSNPFP
jgi:hypothetical protein